MSVLKERLTRACTELAMEIESEFNWTAKDGRVFHPVVRIPSVGAENGMLIFVNHDGLEQYSDEIVQAGFGYSVLSEPRPGTEYDLNAYKEMFADWNGESEDED